MISGIMLQNCKKRAKHQTASNEASTSILLDLPAPLIYDILSRLPLIDIFRSRCVCRMLLKLLKDPYFSKIHLSRCPTLRTNILLQETRRKWGVLRFFPFDHSESTLSSCSSDIHSPINLSMTKFGKEKQSSEFSFRANGLTLLDSSNGLMCLHSNHLLKPSYVVCNPILGECIKIPQLIIAQPPLYPRLNHLGFFSHSPRLNQYKIITFVRVSFLSITKPIVAHVHTLGSDSWRKIEFAPCPKRRPFDPFLNGALHWITDTVSPSELISSFDLESEKFTFLPPPPQFNSRYLNKVSWANVGVLRNCLCICYIYEDVRFDVWVMREYGVRDSWRKEFEIDLKFYCRLRVEDLYRPVKFFENGELWFVSTLGSLMSFSPRKRTFKELRGIGTCNYGASTHDLSFVSVKDVVGENNPDFFTMEIKRRDGLFDLLPFFI